MTNQTEGAGTMGHKLAGVYEDSAGFFAECTCGATNEMRWPRPQLASMAHEDHVSDVLDRIAEIVMEAQR